MSVFTDFIILFFNDTATTEIYTLSLHDALPILVQHPGRGQPLGRPELDRRPVGLEDVVGCLRRQHGRGQLVRRDRKSTRLNSSHANISYAVFCLKKKKKNTKVH